MTSLKNVGLVVLLNLILLLTSCSLLPGKVEYFQKKVKPVPVAADQPRLVESQKQAAQFLDRKVSEARLAAALTQADLTVQTPLSDAASVSGPLFMSLGPPATPWLSSGPDLAKDLSRQTALLDHKVDAYAKRTEPLEGKKIEGTGFFQIGYFTQLALFVGLAAVLWIGWKFLGTVYPVAGLAQNVVGRISSKVFHAGFHQVVEGGEKFKALVKDANCALSPDEIKALYAQAQQMTQDRDVQDVVKKLTLK